MKKLSLLLIIIVSVGYSFSQSLQIVSGDTVLWCVNNSNCDATCIVKNTSNSSKNYMCYRTVIHMETGNTNYFCWGIFCYSPIKDTSSSAVTIAAGDTNSSFNGWLTNAVGTCDDTVEYCFYDQNNPSDMTCLTAIYNYRPTGIGEILTGGNSMFLNAYPNPVDFEATFQYSLPKNINSAEVIIMNILGSKVGEYELNLNKTNSVISTSNLNNGIYFYSLEIDGKVISTKKLLVSHQ